MKQNIRMFLLGVWLAITGAFCISAGVPHSWDIIGVDIWNQNAVSNILFVVIGFVNYIWGIAKLRCNSRQALTNVVRLSII